MNTDTAVPTRDALARLKSILKRYGRLYELLAIIVGGQPMHTTARGFLKPIPRGAVIVSIGSGSKQLRGDVINIDIEPFPGVQVVASAEHLPMQDQSVDAIICDNVLEHVMNPGAAVGEIYRVLKKGGRVYIAVPFMMPFHSSPFDFYRWNKEGLRRLLKEFREDELKIQYGPTAAFGYVAGHWFSLLLSFNSQMLYGFWNVIWMILFIPLKPLDFLLVRLYGAEDIALSFYFIGTKS